MSAERELAGVAVLRAVVKLNTVVRLAREAGIDVTLRVGAGLVRVSIADVDPGGALTIEALTPL